MNEFPPGSRYAEEHDRFINDSLRQLYNGRAQKLRLSLAGISGDSATLAEAEKLEQFARQGGRLAKEEKIMTDMADQKITPMTKLNMLPYGRLSPITFDVLSYIGVKRICDLDGAESALVLWAGPKIVEEATKLAAEAGVDFDPAKATPCPAPASPAKSPPG